MKTEIKKFTKEQFFNIAHMKDPTTGHFSKTVEKQVENTFVDGFKFAFEGAKRDFKKVVMCRSLDGRLGAFFYTDSPQKFAFFICGDGIMDTLLKVYDVAFVF